MPRNLSCLLVVMAATLMSALAYGQDSTYTLRVDQNEVIADLFAVNHSTYRPDRTLSASDIDVFDNNKPVKLTSFTHVGSGSLRPLAVWIITQCDMRGWESSGSRFVQHRASTLTEGLGHLLPEDSVAAAGWCDDGRQSSGVPTNNFVTVSSDVEQWTSQTKINKGTSKRKGELSLQAMLRDISAKAAGMKPRPLPVLAFLHQDDTGADSVEFSRVLNILLEQGSIAFVATDGKGTYQPSPGYLAAGNVGYVLQTLAIETGGSVMVAGSFEEHPKLLSDILASIIDQLHGRYQFSFVPQKHDGKVHTLAVGLSGGGHTIHGSTSLQTRKSYLAPLPE